MLAACSGKRYSTPPVAPGSALRAEAQWRNHIGEPPCFGFLAVADTTGSARFTAAPSAARPASPAIATGGPSCAADKLPAARAISSQPPATAHGGLVRQHRKPKTGSRPLKQSWTISVTFGGCTGGRAETASWGGSLYPGLRQRGQALHCRPARRTLASAPRSSNRTSAAGAVKPTRQKAPLTLGDRTSSNPPPQTVSRETATPAGEALRDLVPT